MTSRPAPMDQFRQAKPAAIGRYLTDDGWVLEQKLNGIRLLVDFTDDGPQPRAKGNAALVAAGPQWRLLEPTLTGTPLVGVTLDGELLPDGTWWVFDAPAGGDGAIHPDVPFATRRAFLDLLFAHFVGVVPGWGEQVRLVDQAVGTAAKQALWDAVLAAPAEGVVAKRLTGRYRTDGRPSDDTVKIKVTHTIDAVITRRNVEGKTNAELAVTDGATLVPIGSISMLGKPDLPVGSVVEVRYLSMALDGKLVQPRLERPRPDKDVTQVPYSQLIFTDDTPIGAAA